MSVTQNTPTRGRITNPDHWGPPLSVTHTPTRGRITNPDHWGAQATEGAQPSLTVQELQFVELEAMAVVSHGGFDMAFAIHTRDEHMMLSLITSLRVARQQHAE
jgi:hypothetical protein